MFVLCAFSLCTLRLYRPYFVTAKCVLEEKLDVNKHAAKLHFSLALMGSEYKEGGRKVEPITITNSDLEVCPRLFFTLVFNAGTNSCRIPLADFSLASGVGLDDPCPFQLRLSCDSMIP